MDSSIVYLIITLISLLLIGISVITYRYTREIKAARQRIDSLGSQVIETKCGPV